MKNTGVDDSEAEWPGTEGRPYLSNKQVCILATSILITSLCALVYQLLISSLSSYLLGSSILHFSLTIGFFMFFMGVGSYASKYLVKNLVEQFIQIEIAIGFVGGISAALLYTSFSLSKYYYISALLIIAIISCLIGLEIPLVARILRARSELKDTLANILAVDYLGALFASIIFPLILVPYLGLMRTAFMIGILNTAIALVTLRAFLPYVVRAKRLLFLGIAVISLLSVGLVFSFRLIGYLEGFIYQDPIIYSAESSYQRIILTKHKNDIRLFLNGNIQFSSIDEYRYHEPLAHIILPKLPSREQVLILGGGDGLLAREVLKYKDVKTVTIVDIDKRMTDLGQKNPIFQKLNDSSMNDPRVRIVNEDAFGFIQESVERFNAVLIDLPDPNDLAIGKLYSVEFYQAIKKRLTADGMLITQASSPFFARAAYWCVASTLEEAFDHVTPLWVYVPSFGPWGFHIASSVSYSLQDGDIPVSTQYLTPSVVPSLFVFDADSERVPTDVNRLDNQKLVEYYEAGWNEWN